MAGRRIRGKRDGFYTDLIEAADRRGKPKVLQWTYDELFARYQDRLVCECVHHPNTLIKGGYEDTQPGGAAAWDRAVDLYVRLWGGTKAP